MGRSRDNDLILPETDSPRSSARHAEFHFEGGGWWIVDLESTNGTLLNGAAVQRARVAQGDCVSFGEDAIAIETAPRLFRPWAIAVVAVMLTVAGAAVGVYRANKGPLDRIAAAGRRSVFLLVVQEGDRRIPVGTAFAIDAAGRLATNAHVGTPIAATLDGRAPGLAFAMSDGVGGAPRRITQVAIHPGWRRGSITSDVALVTLETGPSLDPLPLATKERLAALEPGMSIAMFGFPAAFTDSARPHGSMAANAIRSVRGTEYLILGMSVSPGASGSPVFTEDGVVVGIIAGSQRAGGPGRVEWASTNPAVALTVAALLDMLPPTQRGTSGSDTPSLPGAR